MLCAALAASASLCLFFGARGFAPVVGLGGLLCLPVARPSREDLKGVAILAALVIWGAVSIAWTPDESLRQITSFKLFSRLTILHMGLELFLSTAFVTALARLQAPGAQRALTWTAYGFLAVSVLLMAEGVTHGALYQRLLLVIHQHTPPDLAVRALAQGAYAAVVAVWPLGMALHLRKRTGLALALVAFVPLSMVLLRGFAPTAGLVVSLPVFLLVQRYGARAAYGMAAIMAAYMFLTPLFMLAIDHGGLYATLKPVLPASWGERLRIWSFVIDRFTEHPLRGAGLDASRTFPHIVPLHPHNAPLQLWFELGLPGAALGIAFWVWLWRRIAVCADRDRLYGSVAAATAAVYVMVSAVGFGLWQEWWMCVGSFAMALCILFGKVSAERAGGSSSTAA